MDFSDDQLAIIGCFAAMAICGLIGALTFHFGPAGKSSQQADSARSLAFPPAAKANAATEERKAA